MTHETMTKTARENPIIDAATPLVNSPKKNLERLRNF